MVLPKMTDLHLPASPALAATGHLTRYDRARDLPRLLPLWPEEIADPSPLARWRLARVLARALRRERQRGVAGHWSYDLARHAALLKAYRAERMSTASVRPRAARTVATMPAASNPIS
jgi:uncharacterized protein YbjT (DUF2867 family)